MIDGRNFFDQTVKTNLRTYDNITKITTGQGDDYTTGCLPDYPYFKKYYKLIDNKNYNPGHNILALFNNLAQVKIATSKTILDI